MRGSLLQHPAMDADFWRDRWREGRIGFHLADTNPRLVEHWRDFAGGSAGRVLVPLCGKSVDLAYLASLGHEVVGVELVEDAARAFFEASGVTPTVTRVGGFVRYAEGSVTIVVGDFFATDVELLGGPFDFAYDRAALIALPPAMRRAYVAKLRSLLRATAPILLVLLDFDAGDGPPFSIGAADAGEYYPDARIELLGTVDVTAASPGLKDRGASHVDELSLRIDLPG